MEKKNCLFLLGLFAIAELGAMYSSAVYKNLKKYPKLLQKPSFQSKLPKGFVTEQAMRGKFSADFVDYKLMLSKLPADSVLVCQEGTFQCIPVKKAILPTHMLENLAEFVQAGDISSRVIFLKDCPIAAIEHTFNLVKKYSENAMHSKDVIDRVLRNSIENYSLNDLVGVVNCMNILGYQLDIQNVCLTQIKGLIDKDKQKIFSSAVQKMDPNAQKALLVEPCIKDLKSLIISRYSKQRKTWLKAYYMDIHRAEVMDWIGINPKNENEIITKYQSGGLAVWDVTNPKEVTDRYLPRVYNDTGALSFSPDGVSLVVSSGNKIKIYNKKDYAFSIGEPNVIKAVTFNKDGTELLLGCEGNHNNLSVWNIANKTVDKVILNTLSRITAVAWSSDDSKIVFGGDANDQNNLVLFDITKNTMIPLIGHQHRVTSVAFSPDGTKIVSGSLYGYTSQDNLILWDATTGKMIKSLEGHPGNVNSVAFSKDGKNIISGGIASISGIPMMSDQALIWWDISDIENITHQDIGAGQAWIFSVSCGRGDDFRIASCGTSSIGSGAMFWTLWTKHEQEMIDSLKKCNADQVRLVYQLCLDAKRGLTLIKLEQGSPELKEFEGLSSEMRKFLTDLFSINKVNKGGLLSGWW